MSTFGRISCNVSFMFNELERLVDRYEAAARVGFKLVECGTPYQASSTELAEVCAQLDLKHVLINSPLGQKAQGGKGLACIPGAEMQFRNSLDTALEYAKALKCPRIHVMAGVIPDGASIEKCNETFTGNITYAVDLLSKEGISTLIEPINQYSIPGYFLSSYDKALSIIDAVNSSSLMLQLDVFHLQLIGGNITNVTKKMFSKIGHIQVAQAPGRNEPSYPGEINYEYVFDMLRSMNYTGYIGAEYNPSGASEDSLGWIKKYGLSF